MEAVQESLSFVITPSETDGGDTVIGTKATEDFVSVPIEDVLFPLQNNSDSSNLNHREDFLNSVLPRMKAGEIDIMESMFLKEDGSADNFYVAFAPVTYNILNINDPSDFSQGVNMSTDVIYSVAIGESITTIKSQFYSVQDQMREELLSVVSIYAGVIAAVSFSYIIFCIFVSNKSAVQFTLRL